jgi:hypothetical protein
MSQARKLRRATQGRNPGQGGALTKALGELQGAMGALHGVGELPEVIEGLKTQTARAAQLADALSEDYETLLGRITNLENENIEIMSRLTHLEKNLPVEGK